MNEVFEHSENGYTISTDKSRLDMDVIHGFLSRSYWAEGVPVEVIKRSILNSRAYGIYDKDQQQVGFARVVSDFATFAYLADVFIVDAHRGKGLSKMLMRFILSQPDLKGLRRFLLATRDAHTLYTQFGFTVIKNPENFLQIHQPDVYKKLNVL